MANQISLQPQVLDLALYAGDGVSFRLICTDGSSDPIDITGVVKAWIRVDRHSGSLPIVEFEADLVDAYLGIIVLSLTGEQTQELMDDPSAASGKFTGVWDVAWEPAASEPRTLCQGKVECVADVTQ
jgi:hypothetical protein